jgi:hypothetical protein
MKTILPFTSGNGEAPCGQFGEELWRKNGGPETWLDQFRNIAQVRRRLRVALTDPKVLGLGVNVFIHINLKGFDTRRRCRCR